MFSTITVQQYVRSAIYNLLLKIQYKKLSLLNKGILSKKKKMYILYIKMVIFLFNLYICVWIQHFKDPYLTFSTLWANSADDKLVKAFFFFFFPENRL